MPNPGNPQNLNRYAYSLSNPLKYTDPSGHAVKCTGACDEGNWNPSLSAYGVTLDPDAEFTPLEMLYIIAAVVKVAARIAEATNATDTAAEAFKSTYGVSPNNSMTIRRCGAGECSKLAWTKSSTEIKINTFYSSGSSNFVEKSIHLMVHELGHAFNGRVANVVGQSYYTYNALAQTQTANPSFPNRLDNDIDLQGFAGPRYNWQQSADGSPGEEFADMFLGWAYNKWDAIPNGGLTLAGQARATWMATRMPLWINLASAP